MCEYVLTAREFAQHAHAGQRDKAGREYFDGHLMPITSAAQVFEPDVVADAKTRGEVLGADPTGMRLTLSAGS